MEESGSTCSDLYTRYGSGSNATKTDNTGSFQLESESAPIVHQQHLVLHKRRWYVCFLNTCVFAFLSWNVDQWGPIARSAELIGLTPKWYGLMVTLGLCANIICIIPGGLLVNRCTLRKIILMVSFILAMCCLSRCFFGSKKATERIIVITNVLCDVLVVALLPIPVKASAFWFPPKERMLATTIVVSGGRIGYILANLVGPLFIQEPQEAGFETIRRQYYHYQYCQTCVTIAFYIICLVSYPHDPSEDFSSGGDYLSYFRGFKELIRNRSYLDVAALYTTVIIALLSTLYYLNLWLEDSGILQSEVGMISTVAIVVAVPVGILLGYLTKYGTPRALILFAQIEGLIGMFWLALCVYGWLPVGVGSAAIATVLIKVSILSPWGLILEMVARLGQPTSKEASVAFVSIVTCSFEAVLFAITSVGSNIKWILWLFTVLKVGAIWLCANMKQD